MSALEISAFRGKHGISSAKNLTPCSTDSCGRSATMKISIAGYSWDPKGGRFCGKCAKELEKLWHENVDHREELAA